MKKDYNITKRPPVVTVLGHVDHGKTTLLDKIRHTNIAAKESGGITQSIGAWQITLPDNHKLTFIDTPGHAAFSKMRSRGAEVADIAVLVVAADDGVMPQTLESIKHIKEAGIPFLVAITKIDLPNAQPEKVKNQLIEQGVLLENHGGDIVCVEVSAKTGEGIQELLEMITLLAGIHDISADPTGAIEAVVIESSLDPRRGVVASVIVKNGTLMVGDMVEAEGLTAKIRGIFDQYNNPIQSAPPGMPCEVLGFDRIPPVGAVISYGGNTSSQDKTDYLPKNVFAQKGDKKLRVIIKASSQGVLESLVDQLKGKTEVINAGIGEITQSDIEMASAASAFLIGFRVKAAKTIQKTAEESNVKIYLYDVIYELLEDVKRWLQQKEGEEKEKVLGKAEIVAEFPHSRGRIAGCRVVEGAISKKEQSRLLRAGKILGEVYIKNIRRGKQEVESVKQSEEFGVFFEPQLDFKIGDVLECYRPPVRNNN